MALGDLAFFYHSGDEKQIVGIVEVANLYRPDPSDATGRFGMVDVKAVKPFVEPVTLAAIKAEPRIKALTPVRTSRLSMHTAEKSRCALLSELGRASGRGRVVPGRERPAVGGRSN